MNPSPPYSPSISGIEHLEDPGTGCFTVPFVKLPGSPLSSFEVDKLNQSTDFDATFDNRVVGYYGEFPYKYGGVRHAARPMSDNPYLLEILAAVQDLIPDIAMNSALITRYDSPTSCIPPHSDNEPSIVKPSNIVTVSLGQSRDIQFRSRGGKYSRQILNVSHGEIYTMLGCALLKKF